MSDSTSTQPAPGYQDDTQALRKRLARIEGQIRGISSMVDDGAYCIDVLTQIQAATKALDGVAYKVLEGHADHCVRDAVKAGGAEADQKLEELLEALQRYGRMR